MAADKQPLNIYNMVASPTGEDGKPLTEANDKGEEQPVVARLAIVAPNSRAATQKAVSFFQNVAKGLENVKVVGVEVYSFSLEVNPGQAIVVV